MKFLVLQFINKFGYLQYQRLHDQGRLKGFMILWRIFYYIAYNRYWLTPKEIPSREEEEEEDRRTNDYKKIEMAQGAWV